MRAKIGNNTKGLEIRIVEMEEYTSSIKVVNHNNPYELNVLSRKKPSDLGKWSPGNWRFHRPIMV
jgi:hypothetical protein